MLFKNTLFFKKFHGLITIKHFFFLFSRTIIIHIAFVFYLFYLFFQDILINKEIKTKNRYIQVKKQSKLGFDTNDEKEGFPKYLKISIRCSTNKIIYPKS